MLNGTSLILKRNSRVWNCKSLFQ